MSRLLEQLDVTMPIKTTPANGQYSAISVATIGSTTTSITSTTPTATATASSTLEVKILNDEQHELQQQQQQSNAQLFKPNNFDAVMISLTSGAVAGALAKTTIAPLDRTKINFQINKNVHYSFTAAIDFLKRTYITEGTLALWRGNSATMARIVPYAAIQFTAHEQWRKILSVDKDGADTKIKRFLAGSLAGITSQSLTYPLDLARARMAVTNKYTGYKTLRQVFVRIWIDEGPRTLYRGYWATVLGVIPYAGTSFFTYETLKREYTEMTGYTKLNGLVSLLFGAIAGVVGQTSSYPLDIVRRRMQTFGVTKSDCNQYRTIFTTLKTIYKDEGIKNGFYKGLSMNWIKGPIAVGISFSTYDLIKEFMRELYHLRYGRSIITSTAATTTNESQTN